MTISKAQVLGALDETIRRVTVAIWIMDVRLEQMSENLIEARWAIWAARQALVTPDGEPARDA